MYICHDCQYEFNRPAKTKEKHALSTPPFEVVCVCPRCLSTNYRLAKSDFCRCCGAKLKNGQSDYCSEACKKRGEKLWESELKRKKLLADNPIFEIVRQKDAYNKAHHTNLSYGQFSSMLAAKKKGGGKRG